MKKLIFEWNDAKNDINLSKHDISFEEAQTVFFDESAFEFEDPDHSIDEERFFTFRIQSETQSFGCVPLLSQWWINHSYHFCKESNQERTKRLF